MAKCFPSFIALCTLREFRGWVLQCPLQAHVRGSEWRMVGCVRRAPTTYSVRPRVKGHNPWPMQLLPLLVDCSSSTALSLLPALPNIFFPSPVFPCVCMCVVCMHVCMCLCGINALTMLQWNLPIVATIGEWNFGLYRGVSLSQGLIFNKRVHLGLSEVAYIIEMWSHVRGDLYEESTV